MAEVTTKIYHNTNDNDILVTGLGVIRAHDHVSVTTKYHQPIVLENYPGVVEVTDMDPEAQKEFYAQERDAIDRHAAPRVEAQRQRDDALNVAEAEAKGLKPGDLGYPAPLPRTDVTPAQTPPDNQQPTQGAV